MQAPRSVKWSRLSAVVVADGGEKVLSKKKAELDFMHFFLLLHFFNLFFLWWREMTISTDENLLRNKLGIRSFICSGLVFEWERSNM